MGAVGLAARLQAVEGSEAPSEWQHSWYNTSYRKLFFDYHSHSSALGLASNFDAEAWARRVQEANAQAVSVTLKCGCGWSYYRKGHVRSVHPQLPPGLDMLGELIPALHKRGLRTLGYYNTFESEPVAHDHPNWIVRDAMGAPSGGDIMSGPRICELSPLLNEHMLPHVEEIVSNYEVDGMFFDSPLPRPCYCESCRARFRKDTGADIPKAESDPVWRRYVAWCLDTFREVRQRISDTVHRVRPDMPLLYNWAYSLGQPEVVPAHVGALTMDMGPQDQVFDGSYEARYWAMIGRPFDVQNTAFLKSWGDWGVKPASALQQEVATIIANGGRTWIGYQMTHTFDVAPAVMDQLGKALAFVKEREHLLEGAEPVPYVAVLRSTRAYFEGGKGQFRPDEVPLRGAHRLLLESGIPYHFLHEETLTTRLKEYRAVVMPDVRYLPPKLVSALQSYVEDGGVVLATYRTGSEDADGNPLKQAALQDLLGVRLEGDYDQPHAYIEVTDGKIKRGALDMPHFVPGKFAFAQPVTSEVQVVAKLRKIYLRADGHFLLTSSPVGEDSGYPAVTRRRLGKGTAIYIAGQVFRGFQTEGQWCLKPIIANLLNEAIGQPLVRVESRAWLEVVLMRQGKRTLVHLVNPHSNRPVDGNNVCAEQILEVQDVVVHLAAASRPGRVRLEPGGEEPHWSYTNGMLQVRVPRINIHTAIVVE
jgi:hypothetical protein